MSGKREFFLMTQRQKNLTLRTGEQQKRHLNSFFNLTMDLTNTFFQFPD